MSSQIRDLYGEIMPSDSMSQTVETSSSWDPPINSIGAPAKADEYIVVINTEECLERIKSKSNVIYNLWS
jgi:hypothetical protein